MEKKQGKRERERGEKGMCKRREEKKRGKREKETVTERQEER